VPRGEEAGIGRRLDGLDGGAQPRQGSSLERPQDFRIAPFDAASARQKRAFEQPPGQRHASELVRRRARADPESRRAALGGERHVRPREPQHEIAERIGDRFQQRGRKTGRRHAPEGVAEPRDIFRHHEARLPRHGERRDPLGAEQLRQPGLDRRRVGSSADLLGRQIADATQEIVERFRGVDRRAVQALQLALEGLHGFRIDQLAEFGLAEQIAQQRMIDRQRLRATLGEGRVAVVQEAPPSTRRGSMRRTATAAPYRPSRRAPRRNAHRRARP
jgi:hypothetical protein